MSKLTQPFKLGEDIVPYLDNFERTCEELSFSERTWPERFLTLLPCETAGVAARLC